MTGEMRLVGERTPDLPESGSNGSSGLWPADGGQVGALRPKTVFGENDRRPKCVRAEPVAGNAIRAESDRSGSEAREPSVGGNGEGPKFVRATSVAGSTVWAKSERSKAERPSVGGEMVTARAVSGFPGGHDDAKHPPSAVRIPDPGSSREIRLSRKSMRNRQNTRTNRKFVEGEKGTVACNSRYNFACNPHQPTLSDRLRGIAPLLF